MPTLARIGEQNLDHVPSSPAGASAPHLRSSRVFRARRPDRVTGVTPGAPSDGHHSLERAVEALTGISNPAATGGQPEEPKMTVSFTKTLRQAALVLAFAASASALSSTSSSAYTAEAQAMCTGESIGSKRVSGAAGLRPLQMLSQ